jgi:DNA-directed RNA polymerase specialized sigma24 family protein
MDIAELAQPPKDIFPATRWSLVLAAQDGDANVAQKALSELCHTYWYPLYAYARGSGLSPEDAEDRTQEFFCDLIEKQSIDRVAADKGKLRAFMLTGLKHIIISGFRKTTAAKRGGTAVHTSIDQAAAEFRFAKEASHHESPDVLFEKNWAQAVLDAASAKLQQWYSTADRRPLFDAIRPFLDGRDGGQLITNVAASFKISEGTLRSAIFQMRKRYRSCIEEEIAQTVVSPEDAALELAYLKQVLAKG